MEQSRSIKSTDKGAVKGRVNNIWYYKVYCFMPQLLMLTKVLFKPKDKLMDPSKVEEILSSNKVSKNWKYSKNILKRRQAVLSRV